MYTMHICVCVCIYRHIYREIYIYISRKQGTKRILASDMQQIIWKLNSFNKFDENGVSNNYSKKKNKFSLSANKWTQP